MLRVPLPKQAEALAFASDKDSIALWMWTRTGKSLVAIRWAESRCPSPKVLLVAPLTVLIEWQRELKLEGLSSTLLVGPSIKKLKALDTAERWCLLNYEGLRACPALADQGWDVVILDESTAIKSPSAQISKIILKKLGDVTYRACLAGEPHPESMLEWWTQMTFVIGAGFMGTKSFYEWRAKYFDCGFHIWMPRRGVYKKILEEVARHSFIVRAGDTGNLSRRVLERRWVTMPPAVRQLYKTCQTDFSVYEHEAKHQVVVETWLRILSGGFVPKSPLQRFSFKIDEAVYLVTKEFRGEQGVMWFNFTQELQGVFAALKKTGLKVANIWGGTPFERRKKLLERFRLGKIRWLLCQPECAKFGLDMSAASIAVYYSAPPSYLTRLQTEARIIHPQKTRELLYVDLISQDTVDEAVDEVITRRLAEKRTVAMTDMNAIAEIRRLGIERGWI